MVMYAPLNISLQGSPHPQSLCTSGIVTFWGRETSVMCWTKKWLAAAWPPSLHCPFRPCHLSVQ
jgi:hypothetical protein